MHCTTLHSTITDNTTAITRPSRHHGHAADTHELVGLFRVTRGTAARLFDRARLVRTPRILALYSRAGITELLAAWNERPIPYPSRPLLDLDGAVEILGDLGHELSPSYMSWLSTPSAARVMAHVPRIVYLGDGSYRHRRFQLSDLIEFAQARS